MTIYHIKGGIPSADSARFLRVGAFNVDLLARHLVLNNQFVAIPPCSFECLVTLLRHSPEPVSYKTLASEVKKDKLSQLAAQDLSRMNIYMLRKAIESNPQEPKYILSVPGFGYRLVP